MPIVYAVKSGSWSDPTVWNTGTLPTASDDVYPNNFIVDINGNFTVNSIRNFPDTGVSGSGYFRALNGSVLTTLAIPGVIGRGDTGSALPVYRFDDISPLSSASLNGFIQPQFAPAGSSLTKRAVELNGAGTLYVSGTVNTNVTAGSQTTVYGIVINAGNLVIQGNIFNGSSNFDNQAIRMNTSAGNVTCIGTVNAFRGASSTTVGIFNNSAGGSVYVVGNVYGAGYFENGVAVNGNGASVSRAIVGPRVYITGNVYGGNQTGQVATRPPGYAVESSLFSVTGNVYGGSQFVGNLIDVHANYGVYGVGSVVGDLYGGYDSTAAAVHANNGTITVTGTCYASAFCPAIIGTRGTHILSGPFVAHPDGIPAVGGKFTIPDTTTSVQMSYFRGVAPGAITQFGLYDSGAFESKLPTQQNVRSGTVYGLTSEKTGQMVIPQEATVLKGVTYDITKTGSLDIADAVWGRNITGSFVSGSIGDRMKNVATVASTAAQIVALQ